MKNFLEINRLKGVLSSLLALIIILAPLSAQSIVFLQKDKKGNFHFSCEGMVGESMRIKQVDNNLYKVLGRNVGQLVKASSPSEAAKIVCDENEEQPAKTE